MPSSIEDSSPGGFLGALAGSGALRQDPGRSLSLRNHSAARGHAGPYEFGALEGCAMMGEIYSDRVQQCEETLSGFLQDELAGCEVSRVIGRGRRRADRRLRPRGEDRADRDADPRLWHIPPLHSRIEYGQGAARCRMSGVDGRPHPGRAFQRHRSHQPHSLRDRFGLANLQNVDLGGRAAAPIRRQDDGHPRTRLPAKIPRQPNWNNRFGRK